jgi:hypothetical protein
MAGVGPEDLHDLCEEFLAACVESLNTVPVFAPSLEGAPDRAFVCAGQPAADCCPQLTVHAEFVGELPTEPQGLPAGKRFHRINQVGLVMTLFRCQPTGSETKLGYEPPNIIQLAAAGQQVNADGWALWNHLFNMRNASLLFTRCQGVFWQQLRALIPSGGCAGWTLGVLVNYDGYQEDLTPST